MEKNTTKFLDASKKNVCIEGLSAGLRMGGVGVSWDCFLFSVSMPRAPRNPKRNPPSPPGEDSRFFFQLLLFVFSLVRNPM